MKFSESSALEEDLFDLQVETQSRKTRQVLDPKNTPDDCYESERLDVAGTDSIKEPQTISLARSKYLNDSEFQVVNTESS